MKWILPVILLFIAIIAILLLITFPNKENIVVSPPPSHFGAMDKPVDEMGIVEGSLGFPSETIPEETRVCAETTTTRQLVDCTDERIADEKYTYRVGYKLELPAGNYFVYAQLKDDDYKAYYNEFVECGLSIECLSHEPIEVSITPGETSVNIDVVDWYNRPAPTQ